MAKSIKIFAPATVSNVGSGFDIMGFAISGTGDILEMELTGGEIIEIVNLSGKSIPLNPADNVISPGINAMQEKLGKRRGVRITFHQKINPGSGIGSSAASSAAAAYGYNRLLGSPFTREELVSFAIEGERLATGSAHADNVAPCMLGGFIIIRSYEPLDIIKIPFPSTLCCTVVHPAIELTTRESRNALLKEYPLRDTITQTGNAAALTAGLIMGDFDLIGRSLVDVIAEPRRKGMIPGYDMVRNAALEAGVLGCNISGSGPSIFALASDHDIATRAGEEMKKSFGKAGVKCEVHVSGISDQGVTILS